LGARAAGTRFRLRESQDRPAGSASEVHGRRSVLQGRYGVETHTRYSMDSPNIRQGQRFPVSGTSGTWAGMRWLGNGNLDHLLRPLRPSLAKCHRRMQRLEFRDNLGYCRMIFWSQYSNAAQAETLIWRDAMHPIPFK
jgi:hypothetical protein